MSDCRTIQIRSRVDIIEARMQVRSLARRIGLDLFDQARISLATSTLAIILGLEKKKQGVITVTRLENGGRTGVQVVCIEQSLTLADLASSVLDDARRMVDDLNVEALPTSGIEITLTKWGGKGNNRSAKVVPMAETPMMNV